MQRSVRAPVRAGPCAQRSVRAARESGLARARARLRGHRARAQPEEDAHLCTRALYSYMQYSYTPFSPFYIEALVDILVRVLHEHSSDIH